MVLSIRVVLYSFRRLVLIEELLSGPLGGHL